MKQAIVGNARDYFEGVWVLTDRPLDLDTPGAPLLDREGQVVGVSTAGKDNRFKGENVWEASPDILALVNAHFTMGVQDVKHP